MKTRKVTLTIEAETSLNERQLKTLIDEFFHDSAVEIIQVQINTIQKP